MVTVTISGTIPDGDAMSYPTWLRDPLLIEVDRKLSQIIDQLAKQESKMSVSLDALTAQVAQNTQVEASAVTLIQGIAAQLAEAAADPAKVQALSDQLKASADSLAAAVTANTQPA